MELADCSPMQAQIVAAPNCQFVVANCYNQQQQHLASTSSSSVAQSRCAAQAAAAAAILDYQPSNTIVTKHQHQQQVMQQAYYNLCDQSAIDSAHVPQITNSKQEQQIASPKMRESESTKMFDANNFGCNGSKSSTTTSSPTTTPISSRSPNSISGRCLSATDLKAAVPSPNCDNSYLANISSQLVVGQQQENNNYYNNQQQQQQQQDKLINSNDNSQQQLSSQADADNDELRLIVSSGNYAHGYEIDTSSHYLNSNEQEEASAASHWSLEVDIAQMHQQHHQSTSELTYNGHDEFHSVARLVPTTSPNYNNQQQQQQQQTSSNKTKSDFNNNTNTRNTTISNNNSNSSSDVLISSSSGAAAASASDYLAQQTGNCGEDIDIELQNYQSFRNDLVTNETYDSHGNNNLFTNELDSSGSNATFFYPQSDQRLKQQNHQQQQQQHQLHRQQQQQQQQQQHHHHHHHNQLSNNNNVDNNSYEQLNIVPSENFRRQCVGSDILSDQSVLSSHQQTHHQLGQQQVRLQQRQQLRQSPTSSHCGHNLNVTRYDLPVCHQQQLSNGNSGNSKQSPQLDNGNHHHQQQHNHHQQQQQLNHQQQQLNHQQQHQQHQHQHQHQSQNATFSHLNTNHYHHQHHHHHQQNHQSSQHDASFCNQHLYHPSELISSSQPMLKEQYNILTNSFVGDFQEQQQQILLQQQQQADIQQTNSMIATTTSKQAGREELNCIQLDNLRENIYNQLNQVQPIVDDENTQLQELNNSQHQNSNIISTINTTTNSNVSSTNLNNTKLRLIKGRRGRPRKKGLRSKNKVNGKLWEFIRDLLLNERTNPSFIRWERREDGVFKFVQSDKVAKMWGERKQNPKMTYEKLSRAMRYYYKSKVLLPVFGRRLVYKFGPNATGWLPSPSDGLIKQTRQDLSCI